MVGHVPGTAYLMKVRRAFRGLACGLALAVRPAGLERHPWTLIVKRLREF